MIENKYALALDGLEIEDPVESFFDFCKERENIRISRENGEDFPWSKDEIFQNGRFLNVFSIPRGGIPFEKALKPYCSNNDNDPLLICDDVYTTGTSMREVYEDGALGIVVFARNEIQDDWVKAIWQLSI